MTEVTVAIIGALSAVAVALTEKSRRENKRDHGEVSRKLDMMGKSLGRSIDRVEQSVQRTESKLDEHIGDHARGTFNKDK